MKNRLLFCAALAAVATQLLHAQSTGLVVTSGNNVGIGTTNPATQLHVYGTIAGNAALLRSETTQGSGSANVGLWMIGGATNANWLIGTNRGDIAGAGDSLMFYKVAGTYGPKMVINDAGNVGIGATTPASDSGWASPALDISGIRGTAIIRTNAADGIATLRMTGPGASHIDDWAINMYAGSTSTFSIFPQAGSTGAAFTITNAGNVGIGTINPTTKLEVNGGTLSVRPSTSSLYGYVAINPGGSGYAGYIDWYKNGPTRLAYMGYQDSGGSQNNLGLNLENSANFVIGGGNVGIGVTSPGYKLDVAGPVHATSFISSTQTYADFVFKPDYKLATLNEVEASIKKEGHLPGIPSEEEAKSHGIDITQMQVKLLQKVEEMTLYVIELKKENAELRKKVDQLSASKSQ